MADLKLRSEDLAIPLFAMDPKRRLIPFTSNDEPPVKSGWEIMALQMKPGHPVSVEAGNGPVEPDVPI